MKILFFLMVIANVALFMWEYKTGAFVPVTETSDQNADLDQEQILLVSELKNVPQVMAPAPVSEPPIAETAVPDVASKAALVPGPLPSITENIDNPALQESTTSDSNVSELTNVPQAISPAPVTEPSLEETVATGEANKPVLVPEPLPAISEKIDKPALEESIANDSTIRNAEKNPERCYEAGPFTNQKAYQAWVNRLKDINSEIKPIKRDEHVAINYMVYYPEAATESGSEDNIKMLKDHGIKDLWLLTGEDKGKISLGLFIKEESALVMKNELLAKGINAEVKARYKTKSQQYVLIKGDDKLMENLGDLKNAYPELAITQITDATQGCW